MPHNHTIVHTKIEIKYKTQLKGIIFYPNLKVLMAHKILLSRNLPLKFSSKGFELQKKRKREKNVTS